MCKKYRKFNTLKIWYVFDEIFSIICDKCGSKYEKMFTEALSIEILNILRLKTVTFQRNLFASMKILFASMSMKPF